MDDPKPPAEGDLLPERDPRGAPIPSSEESAAVVPLQLVLYPGGITVTLMRADMVAGRHSTADLRLHLPDVSRRHCRFVFAGGRWEVFDLHSLNGLFVNDERVERAVLRHRDLIRIGSYTFEVNLEQGPATVPLGPSASKIPDGVLDILPHVEPGPRRQAS